MSGYKKQMHVGTERQGEVVYKMYVVAHAPKAELGDDEAAALQRFEAVCESYEMALQARLNMSARMVEAAMRLPQDVSHDEQALVLALEQEVDAALGEGARLYGRAVALHAIRDLQQP